MSSLKGSNTHILCLIHPDARFSLKKATPTFCKCVSCAFYTYINEKY
ncbi:hypothetical protein GBAR_LOCUS22726 [Geodia barretti]|uniref:Uncharacterized protein n=1 Tax=Geodia barretti TaxID=519541 RepID=A0AA35T3N6_GEOBA|nr:hypothetical protein GBAR_LOCUS22726 [Geodia barretti]